MKKNSTRRVRLEKERARKERTPAKRTLCIAYHQHTAACQYAEEKEFMAPGCS